MFIILVQNIFTSSYKTLQSDMYMNTPVIVGKHGRMKPEVKTDKTGPKQQSVRKKQRVSKEKPLCPHGLTGRFFSLVNKHTIHSHQKYILIFISCMFQQSIIIQHEEKASRKPQIKVPFVFFLLKFYKVQTIQ